MRRSRTRFLTAAYERGGVRVIQRALLAQQGLAVVVVIAGPLLTLLYASLSVADFAILLALNFVIFLADGALAVAAIRPGLRALDSWSDAHDEPTARAAWRSLVDVPFAPLRKGATYLVVVALIIVWDLVAVSLLGLSATSVLLLFPGSVLLWLYWLAVRFFVSEQIVRPVLADISTELPDSDAGYPVQITLARRLFIAVPAITVMAGTVAAGVVGERTIEALALGVGASILVAAGIAGWLVVLLARSVSEPIAELRAATDRVGRGDLEVRIPVVSTDEMGALARSFNEMVMGLRERERIRETFGRYVDRSVAEHILQAGPDLLAGEQVEITALFLDVRGFTGYAERRPARDVVAMLNRLFEVVVPIIRHHSGHVDKFIGDGLLAVFGVPQPLTDHAESALAAAAEIAAAVETRPDDEPSIGIGVNSGVVVAGNIGGSGRFEFSVIGDVVNVAARIESATRQTGDVILLSEHTYNRLQPAAQSALIGRPGLVLKGKSEPVTLYAPHG